MSQVNLLPPEIRMRQRTRRLTSVIVLAGIGVLALVGLFYFMQTQKLADTQDQLEAQNARNAELNAQIQELQSFAELQAELASAQQLVQVLFQNEVSWSSVLLDVSRVIPDASYLTSMTAQISPLSAGTAPETPVAGTPESTLIGNMAFQGIAQETETIAVWLTRLEQVRGWVNAWVTGASENAPFSRIYTFSSGLDLSLDASTERGRGEVP